MVVECPRVNITLVADKISEMKLRKAGGHDGLQNEHVIHAGPNMVVHLSLLFNALLRHSCVPDDFHFGVIKPLLKSKHEDLTKVDIYRGITLTPVISKLFEAVLLSLYGKYLYSDCLQFGFKKNSGYNDAMFTFNQRNSKVLCTFIDASKTFDKVLVNGLLCKLIKRNAPVEFIRILYS